MRKNTLGSLIWLRIVPFTHQSNLLSNDFLKQFDLTTAQFDVLNQVSVYEPISQRDLAEKVTVSQGGISRMVRQLLFQLKDRKSTRLNSSHVAISYAVFCLKKKNKNL